MEQRQAAQCLGEFTALEEALLASREEHPLAPLGKICYSSVAPVGAGGYCDAEALSQEEEGGEG